MTGWDIANKIFDAMPLTAGVLLFIAAAMVFIIGFAKRGMNFIKYGFGQTALDDSLDTRLKELSANIKEGNDSLRAEFKQDIADLRAEVKDDIANLRTEVNNNIADLRAEVKDDIADLRAEFTGELTAIKTNHFGHLKAYLSILNGVLLDKDIINNETKARLDNEVAGM